MAMQAKAEPIDRVVCGDCGQVIGTMAHQPSNVGVISLEWYQWLDETARGAITHHAIATSHTVYIRQETLVLTIEEGEAQ